LINFDNAEFDERNINKGHEVKIIDGS